MAKKYCRKFNLVSRAHERLDDRRICDSEDPNVTQSRSAKKLTLEFRCQNRLGKFLSDLVWNSGHGYACLPAVFADRALQLCRANWRVYEWTLWPASERRYVIGITWVTGRRLCCNRTVRCHGASDAATTSVMGARTTQNSGWGFQHPQFCPLTCNWL